MRVYNGLLSLGLATCIAALNVAVPGELMWAYTVYKAEYRAWKLGLITSRTMATGCTHDSTNWPSSTANNKDEATFIAAAEAAGMQGICAFDEFAKHIGKQSGWAGYAYDSVGHSLNPNFKKIKAKIVTYGQNKQSGARPKLLQDFEKLYPGRWADTSTVAWATGVRAISDTMHDARLALTTDSVMAGLLSDAQDFIKYAHNYRLNDREANIYKNLKGWANKQPGLIGLFAAHAVTHKVDFYIPGTTEVAATIDSVDFAATLAATKVDQYGNTVDVWSPQDQAGLQQQLSDYNAKATTVEHQDVIDAMHAETNRLATSVSSCSATKRDLLSRRYRSKKPVRKARSVLRRIFAGVELIAPKTV